MITIADVRTVYGNVFIDLEEDHLGSVSRETIPLMENMRVKDFLNWLNCFGIHLRDIGRRFHVHVVRKASIIKRFYYFDKKLILKKQSPVAHREGRNLTVDATDEGLTSLFLQGVYLHIFLENFTLTEISAEALPNEERKYMFLEADVQKPDELLPCENSGSADRCY